MIQELKPTDLRIGNLLKIIFTGEIVEISSIDRIGLLEYKPINSDEEFEDSLSAFEPIPLTEEWLVRCGFEKDKHGFTLKNKYSLSLSIDKNGKIRACFNDRFLTDVPIIQHVHQLQNLYFALTSQELTIKDK